MPLSMYYFRQNAFFGMQDANKLILATILFIKWKISGLDANRSFSLPSQKQRRRARAAAPRDQRAMASGWKHNFKPFLPVRYSFEFKSLPGF